MTSETVGFAVFGIEATGDFTRDAGTVGTLEEMAVMLGGCLGPLRAIPCDCDSGDVGHVPSTGELILEPDTEAD